MFSSVLATISSLDALLIANGSPGGCCCCCLRR